MAKRLLDGYKIGGDIIDRVAPVAEVVMTVPSLPPEQNTVGQSPAVSTEEIPEQPAQPGKAEDTAAKSEPEPETQGTQEDKNTHEDQEAASESSEQAAVDHEGFAEAIAFTVKKDGLFQVFVIDGTTYRVGGIKPLFVTSLRVNIRASLDDRTYYDSLDLYSAKGRSGYASALNRQWGVRSWMIERDLVRILEHLEHDRDEQLCTTSRKPVIEITQEDRALGLELLKDPALFTRIVDDLSALGYVGEDLNKQLLYLCASSRKLDDPISVLILSQSASGKSFLVDSVKKLMPAEDVVAVTSLSDQALNYLEDLMHKFLVLGEAVHGEIVEHQIREMLSGKELSRMVAIKDPETGKLATQIVRTPVIVASVMSGTNHQINPENASRCFIINTDESRDQTARIHTQQRGKYSLDRLRTGTAQALRTIKSHHAAQRLLRSLNIVNDFAPLLDFPVNLMRLRRDHDRFLDLIACVCFLRQYQKPLRHDGAVEYIECDLEDYATAYRIMVEGVLASTVRELPKGAVGLYDELREWVKQEAIRQALKPTEISFTQREAREVTGLSHTWIQVGLRQLVEYEYLTVIRGGGPRSKGHYRLQGDEGIRGADLSMIPTPAIMKTLWEARV